MRATASSTQPANHGYRFDPTNLIDGALDTSWQARAATGQWIRLELEAETTVTEVAVANGFQTKDRFGDEFLLNSRVATGRLRFSDGGELPIEFTPSARGYTRFPIPNKRTKTVELLIDAVHAGTKWKDLAISEVEIIGVGQVRAGTVGRELAWNPPIGTPSSVVVSAHAFAGIDERDLGRLFTRDLKAISGSNLFEKVEARKVTRNSIEHTVIRLREKLELEASFNYFFLSLGASYDKARIYELHRAMEVTNVVRAEEVAMRKPPDAAMFFLAEVHLGASIDLLIQGSQHRMGAELKAQVAKAGGTFRSVHASSDYRMNAFGLGVRAINGDGIFSQTFEDISTRYRTGESVPVQLVFRTVPGRTYKAEQLPMPTVIVNETFTVPEKASKEWAVAPGRYAIDARSDPNGLTLSWRAGAVTCDQELKRIEQRSVKLTCVVSESTTLVVQNPSEFSLGPIETMTVTLTRLP